jgi:hypothetical protein
MPLDQTQRTKVGNFLVELLKGTADLGFSALPLIGLYNQARAEKVPLMDLLIASPGAVDGIMASLQRQATKLPEPALIAMEKILADARKAKAATPPR